ncbi:MAG: c-type cytochrome [Natronospirillum sp.]|uniref:c-type cytochrome n=1 Tax=Natronospirillum sp. TaxID=2812955 RepID=UPI0025F84551|nr:c-type cytochrome [Natronospirillum sp.]MCH8551722.1 c-type cytochrome [Natronospirillum sp.]
MAVWLFGLSVLGAVHSVGAEQLKDPLQTVEQNCLSCHQSGAGNAPRPQNHGDWRSLLEEYTLEQLVDHAWDGRGRMPARGFCRDCTYEDIEQAVLYMIPQRLLQDSSDD